VKRVWRKQQIECLKTAVNPLRGLWSKGEMPPHAVRSLETSVCNVYGGDKEAMSFGKLSVKKATICWLIHVPTLAFRSTRLVPYKAANF
jgi:hypothetical protein